MTDPTPTIFAGLSPPYSTIVADPPWHQEGSGTAYTSITRPPYPAMALSEIAALPVESIASGSSRVFLWVTNYHLRNAWSIVEAWGFTPHNRVLVWCKPSRGMTPVTTEFILIGKRGKPPRIPWHGTTWFQWPLRPNHSQKPEAFIDLVEQWCPGPYVELFARQPRLGWDSWGNGYELEVTNV